MTEWNVETALNHHVACSVYDDGACTCGLRARREQIERSPLAPGEGTWSVFAQKVVAERDAAREEVARLTDEVKRLRGALTGSVWIVTVGSLYEGGDVESVHETREAGMLVVERLLAENAKECAFARSMEDDPWERPPMEQRDDDDFWTDGSEFIKLKEWAVKP